MHSWLGHWCDLGGVNTPSIALSDWRQPKPLPEPPTGPPWYILTELIRTPIRRPSVWGGSTPQRVIRASCARAYRQAHHVQRHNIYEICVNMVDAFGNRNSGCVLVN